MAQRSHRPILAVAMLILGAALAACGAMSPTAPSKAPISLGSGSYVLMVYGTSTCLADGGTTAGTAASAASVPIVLEPGETPGLWRVSAPGQSLTGEVGVVDDAVEGYVRGSADAETVRFATGETPDATVAFQGAPAQDHYKGLILAGTPRFEGLGADSGTIITCASNGFTLKRP